MKKWSIAIFLFLPLFSLTALVEETIDPKSAPCVLLSTTAPNRIAFEGGSISDIIFDESKFHSFLHQKSGQAFLTPLKEMEEVPTTITIVTSSGDVQTLQVLAKPSPGEIVILKERETDSLEPLESLSYNYHAPTVDLLNDLLHGGVPKGYGNVTPLGCPFALPPPFCVTPLRQVEGPFEEMTVLEICNGSKRIEHLEPEQLKRPGDLWCFLSKRHLEPKEKTIAIICTKKEG